MINRQTFKIDPLSNLSNIRKNKESLYTNKTMMNVAQINLSKSRSSEDGSPNSKYMNN